MHVSTWSLLAPPQTPLTYTPRGHPCSVSAVGSEWAAHTTSPRLARTSKSSGCPTWRTQVPFQHLFPPVLSLLPPLLILSFSTDLPQTQLSPWCLLKLLAQLQRSPRHSYSFHRAAPPPSVSSLRTLLPCHTSPTLQVMRARGKPVLLVLMCSIF